MFENLTDWLFKEDKPLIINRHLVNRQKKSEEEYLNFLPIKKGIEKIATFEDVIKWFSENSNYSNIDKGIIIKKPHPQGKLIIQVFLDTKDEVVRDTQGNPIGRKFIAKTLDDELLENFGQTNVIIGNYLRQENLSKNNLFTIQQLSQNF